MCVVLGGEMVGRQCSVTSSSMAAITLISSRASVRLGVESSVKIRSMLRLMTFTVTIVIR